MRNRLTYISLESGRYNGGDGGVMCSLFII